MQMFPRVQRKSFGEKLNAGIGNALEMGSQMMKTSRENEAIKKATGADLSDIYDPEVRQQMIADALTRGKANRKAEATQNVDYSPQGSQQRSQQSSRETPQERTRFSDEIQPQRKEQLPGFLGKEQANQAEVSPAFSHGPQPETAGRKKKVLNPDEVLSEGQRIAKQQSVAGVPTTVLEGYQIAESMNNANKQYNNEVEQDINQQVKSQEKYGALGVDKLAKVLENPTDEQNALFMRKGEEYSKNHLSEADINKKLAIDARNFKNTLANVKKSLPAPRLIEGAKQDVLGTNRAWEKRRDDLRAKLRPLLKEGLYDTARNLLSELGYHPEEREGIISDLGEGSKKTLAKFPKIEYEKTPMFKKGTKSSELKNKYSEENLDLIGQNIRETLANDPSANLVLLRKAYEEKGVDWRVFKDNINDIINNEEMSLNDDQLSMLDTLDNPPLDNLDKILFKLKLIGR